MTTKFMVPFFTLHPNSRCKSSSSRFLSQLYDDLYGQDSQMDNFYSISSIEIVDKVNLQRIVKNNPHLTVQHQNQSHCSSSMVEDKSEQNNSISNSISSSGQETPEVNIRSILCVASGQTTISNAIRNFFEESTLPSLESDDILAVQSDNKKSLISIDSSTLIGSNQSVLQIQPNDLHQHNLISNRVIKEKQQQEKEHNLIPVFENWMSIQNRCPLNKGSRVKQNFILQKRKQQMASKQQIMNSSSLLGYLCGIIVLILSIMMYFTPFPYETYITADQSIAYYAFWHKPEALLSLTPSIKQAAESLSMRDFISIITSYALPDTLQALLTNQLQL